MKLKYYVYAHYKADTNEIFYIGKGFRNRIYSKQHRSKHWHNIVNKHGLRVEKLYQNLDEHTALQLEIQTIAYHGRKDKGYGNLINLTDGGEGMSGYKHTDEILQNHSNFMTTSNPFLDKHHTKESKIKVKNTSLENFGVSNYGLLQCKAVIAYISIKNEKIILGEYDSYIEAMRETKIHCGSISNYVLGKQKTAGIYNILTKEFIQLKGMIKIPDNCHKIYWELVK